MGLSEVSERLIREAVIISYSHTSQKIWLLVVALILFHKPSKTGRMKLVCISLHMGGYRWLSRFVFIVDYNPSNPQASHFTQVVWKGTTQGRERVA